MVTGGPDWAATRAANKGRVDPTSRVRAAGYQPYGAAYQPTYGYAPEYSDEAINKLVSGYAGTLDPYYDREMKKIQAAMPGMAGTPQANKMQLLAGQKMGQIGGYATQLGQEALGAKRGERLLGEERAYEQPFREAPITGQYGGQWTTSMLPYVTSGYLGQTPGTSGGYGTIQTERGISPEWQASYGAGFASPYEQSMYITDPEAYERMYGKYEKPAARKSGYFNYDPYSGMSKTGGGYNMSSGTADILNRYSQYF